MAMIKAGALINRVVLQQLAAGSPQQDAGGAPDESWADITNGEVYAAIAPLKGREFMQAQQISNEITGTIRIRYRDDLTVTSRMRVKWAQAGRAVRYFEILAVVDPDEAHRELVLYTREGPNDG